MKTRTVYRMATLRRKNPDGTYTTIGGSSSNTTTPTTIDYSQDAQKASQQGYNSANYQSNWGIGNYNNITGGFNNFNDVNSLRTERERVNTVMNNRTGYGLDNTQYQNYMTKLDAAYKPITDAENKANTAWDTYNTQQTQRYDDYMSQFNNFTNQAQTAQDSWRSSQSAQGLADSQNATISSIASKYGFDFSRDTARQQAEAEAQAQRNANADAQRRNKSSNELNTAKIDANIMNAVEGLDANYFQQGLAQQQNQVNSGLNAGIANDQALRLQMARQAEMADVYRDANLGLMEEQQRFSNDDVRLSEALGLINQQALAREQSLWDEQQKYLYDVIAQDRNHYLSATDMERQASNSMANLLMQQQNALTNNYQFDTNLGYNTYRDTVADTQFDRNLFTQQAQNALANQQWQQQFGYNQQRDQVADQQWNQQFDWSKLMDEAGLTGMYNGNRTMDGQSFDWSKLMDEAGLTGMYNGQKTWDRQLQEMELALQQQSLAQRYSGGGGSSSSSAGTKASSNLSNAYNQFKQTKYDTPSNPTDAYYMDALKNVPQSALDLYKKTSSYPVMQNKTYNERVNEALVQGALAPPTTTNLQKVMNLNNVMRR